MRAVFFGDSMTYGHGLPDCIDKENGGVGLGRMAGPKPSDIGWASIVSRELNLPCVNLSRPGASNLEIFWTIRNAAIRCSDLVIVQWSFPERGCLLENKIVQIGPWMEDDLAKSYYLTHSKMDLENRNMLLVEHAALLLERAGAKWMFFANIDKGFSKPIRKLLIDFYETCECDIAEDGAHPGIESNKAWASIVLKHALCRLSGDDWPYGL